MRPDDTLSSYRTHLVSVVIHFCCKKIQINYTNSLKYSVVGLKIDFWSIIKTDSVVNHAAVSRECSVYLEALSTRQRENSDKFIDKERK